MIIIFIEQTEDYLVRSTFERNDEFDFLIVKHSLHTVNYLTGEEKVSDALGYCETIYCNLELMKNDWDYAIVALESYTVNAEIIAEKIREHNPTVKRFAILDKLEIFKPYRRSGLGTLLIEHTMKDLSVIGAESFGLEPGWPNWINENPVNINKVDMPMI